MKKRYLLSILLIITVIIGYLFYIQIRQNELQQAQENQIKEYIEAKKSESELSISEILSRLNKAEQELQPKVEAQLQEKVTLAYDEAHKIYDKYKKSKTKKALQKEIKNALAQLHFQDKTSVVFIKNYLGDTLLHKDDNRNRQYRDIDLESIQKVRKHKEGYLHYVSLSDEKKIVYVKNLDLFDWYIGAKANMHTQQELLKLHLLEDFNSLSLDKGEFIGVFKEQHPLYLTKKIEIDTNKFSHNGIWHRAKNSYYYTLYDKEFQWHLLYGFDTENMISSIKQK